MHRIIVSRLRRAIVASAFVVFALPQLAAAQGAIPLPAGITRIASVEGITEYRLSNGLQVLIFPDASKPTATINVTYMVGSRHEGYGESGMSHLLEHLVFKGTPKHPNIPQELTEHGARPNGTTWFDRTNYFETVPATDVNIEWALDLEADRMVNSFIAKKDLESEFTVVRNEFESRENSPQNVLLERVMSTAYLWHGYGRSTIGAKADLENVPIERLQAYYRRYYQPDNAMLVVAGKIDEAKILQLIAQKFGVIPKPVRSLDRGNMLFPTYTEEPIQDGEREVSLRRTGDVQVAMAAYHIPAAAHPDYAPVAVLAQLLSTAPSGRLYKALVESKKASTAGAFSWALKEPSLLMANATVRKEQSLEEAKNILVQTIEAVPTTAPTVEEVERAKLNMVKNIELQLTNSASVGLDLSEWASAGDWRLIYIYRDRLKKVTPADVQRVAAAYLKPSNRTTGLFHPTENPVRATVAAISDAEIRTLAAAFRGDSNYSAGEAFDPSPTNVDARTTRSALPGGFKLSLLPKKNRGATVTARVTLRFGDEKSLTGRADAARWMSAMLNRGTKNRTRQQIADEFDKLKTQATFGGAGNNVIATITTTRPNLLAAMRLAAEVLKEPAFPQNEFDTYKRQQLAGIENFRTEPSIIAQVALQKKLLGYPKGHPLYITSVDEDVASFNALTVDQVKAIHSELLGATYGDLAVVGDFAADSVTTLARELFGSWRSPKPFARLERKFFDVIGSKQKIETPDKANAVYVAGQNLKVRDDSKEWPALVIANYIMGGGFLNSRLAVRIRQKDGISYGVGSGIQTQALDSVGMFTENAIYNPENVARLEVAFEEELARVLKDGFTADEVEKAKQGYLQQLMQNRASDVGLATLFSSQVSNNRTMKFDQGYEAAMAALTVADVNAAVKKHIDPKKLSVVMAGDFKNKPPKIVP
jgi:zinc protease